MQIRNNNNNHTYWQSFVDRFFSQSGVLRTQLYSMSGQPAKSYEISNSCLSKFYYTHFNNGYQNIQMSLERVTDRDLPGGGHFIDCQRCTYYYWMTNGHVVRNVCLVFYEIRLTYNRSSTTALYPHSLIIWARSIY